MKQFQGSLGPFTDSGNERIHPAPKSKLSGQVEPTRCRSCAIAEWLATDGIAWVIVAACWGSFVWWAL